MTQIKVSFLAIFHHFLVHFDLIFWFELFQNIALVIFWYQKGTPSHPTYPKICLVDFKTAVECLKFLKNGQNCPRTRLSYLQIQSLNFGWGVLRWVAWTISSDACLLDQITYVIFFSIFPFLAHHSELYYYILFVLAIPHLRYITRTHKVCV